MLIQCNPTIYLNISWPWPMPATEFNFIIIPCGACYHETQSGWSILTSLIGCLCAMICQGWRATKTISSVNYCLHFSHYRNITLLFFFVNRMFIFCMYHCSLAEVTHVKYDCEAVDSMDILQIKLIAEALVPNQVTPLNTLKLSQNGCHFTEVLKCIFLNENLWISLRISLKFIPKVPINNIPALVQIMARHRSDNKPLSEPMMVSFLMHICVPRPQWVNNDIILMIIITGIY